MNGFIHRHKKALTAGAALCAAVLPLLLICRRKGGKKAQEGDAA